MLLSVVYTHLHCNIASFVYLHIFHFLVPIHSNLLAPVVIPLPTNKQTEIILYHFVYPFSISLIFFCMWGNGQVKSVAINGAWNQHQSRAKYWLFKGCYLWYWVWCYPLCQVSQQIQVINLFLICFVLFFPCNSCLTWTRILVCQ